MLAGSERALTPERACRAVVTAKSCQCPGIAPSSWIPWSANEIPDPTTRSLTVRETRISAGCAWAVTRTISTEIPDLVVGQVHFPVWIPARSCIPCAAASARMAAAD
jgi:hypothetical protein